MEWNKDSWVWLFLGMCLGLAIFITIDSKVGEDGNLFNKPDTTYNKVKLDSIQVQVGKHDTTIYKLNIKLKDDVEKSYQLSDSATVDLFKQLSTGTSKSY